MAGPFSIQKVPLGLLSLLGMKGLGQTPGDLAQSVAPIIDVTEAYSYPLEVRTFAAVVTGVGQTFGGFVPPGERWILYAVSIDITAPSVTANHTFAVNLNLPNGTGGISPSTLGALGLNVTAAGPSLFRQLPTLVKPIWLPPGAAFEGYVEAASAIGNTVRVRLLVNPLSQ